MKSKIYILGFVSLFLSVEQLTAKTANIDNSSITIETNLKEINDDNWSFYVDEDSQTYFIDFEKINYNLSDIIIKNKEGEVLFQDEVLDLPVDSIYELDFSPFGMGEYEVELRSFTGIMRKKVSIK